MDLSESAGQPGERGTEMVEPGPESRSACRGPGSVVTKTIWTWRRSATGMALMADAAVYMFSGQRSGQWV